MPLKPGKSKAVISKNIKEMMKGPRHAKNKRKFGPTKAQKIAIASAFANARRKR